MELNGMCKLKLHNIGAKETYRGGEHQLVYPPQHGWMDEAEYQQSVKNRDKIDGFEFSSKNGVRKLEVQVDSSVVLDGVQTEKVGSAKG
ncbi:hypothetical protein A2U01_0010653, partial [Trifolium medium]|nr:hypothetical protein [Trifolium medium]